MSSATLPDLRKTDLELIRKTMYSEARRECDDAIKEFANCASGKNIEMGMEIGDGVEMAIGDG